MDNMIKIHDRGNRGKTRTGWLNSAHTFSFGDFRDPTRMGFKTLRVINDDVVVPGAGFDTHPHKDMEIITYILEGELAHKDSLGTGSVIRPGEIQRMSAGTGILHSEFNPSNDNPVHLLQIWMLPESKGLPPSYEQKKIPDVRNEFVLIGDRQGTGGAITVHQDAHIYAAKIDEGQKVIHDFKGGRSGFLHVARGQVILNGEVLKEGDGAEIPDTPQIILEGLTDTEVLLFDMA